MQRALQGDFDLPNAVVIFQRLHSGGILYNVLDVPLLDLQCLQTLRPHPPLTWTSIYPVPQWMTIRDQNRGRVQDSKDFVEMSWGFFALLDSLAQKWSWRRTR